MVIINNFTIEDQDTKKINASAITTDQFRGRMKNKPDISVFQTMIKKTEHEKGISENAHRL